MAQCPVNILKNGLHANFAVPTDEDLNHDGLNIFFFQAKFLQKIEELTLYVIKLKKENDKLNQRIIKIENKGKEQLK